jgi:hypothetical protein
MILYANSSMMSRDPDGVDPDGPGLAGLEPTGVHSMEELMYSMESPSQGVSEFSPRGSEFSPRETESIPTPRGAQQQGQTAFHLDVATLVGAPPPPPETPPPKKNRRRSKTPKGEISSGSGSAFFGDEVPVVPTPPREVTTPKHSTVDHSSHNSLEKQSPETEKTLSSTEERREKALAMYHSEDLVLDEEEEEAKQPKQETIRTAMMTLDNKPQIVQQRVSPREFHKAAASPRSLRSESTEPHSNQRRHQPVAMENGTSYRMEQHQESPQEDDSSDHLIKKQQQQARRRSVSVDKKEKEKQKDAEIKQAKDNKKRGFFKKLFRKGSGSKETASDDSKSTKKRSDGTPKDSESVSTPSYKSSSSPRSKQREPSPRAQEPSPRAQSSTPRALQSPPREKRIFQSSPREIDLPEDPQTSDEQYTVLSPQPSEEREPAFFGNDLGILASKSYDSDLEALEEQLRFGFGATIAPMAPSPQSKYTPGPVYEAHLPTTFSNVSRLASSPPVVKSIRTMDPPDEDGHCDPPVYTGSPLKSPFARNQLKVTVSTSEDEEDEHSRIESVRSRIAGVYEEHLYHDADEEDEDGPLSGVPNSLSDDRPEVFFAHDEVSTLTGPSFESLSRKSMLADPALAADGIYSEPFGHYFDPRLSTRAHDGGPPPAYGTTNIDPYQTPFFAKEREHGPLPTPAHVARLRVDVPDHPVYDPDGDSPLHTTTPVHGRVSYSQYKDPVGESPMAWAKKTHSGYNVSSDESAATRKTGVTFYDPDGSSPSKDAFLVPTPANKVPAGELEEGEAEDPPLDLHAGYISDDSTEAEEKKEDTPEVVGDALGAEAQKSISAEDSTVESTTASESSAMEAMASPPRDKKNVSKATRAALRLSKTTGTAALKAHLDEIPTPTNAETNDSIMGSTPIMSPLAPAQAEDKESKEVGMNIAAGLDKVASNADDRSKLHVDTDISKAGFRSAVSTPVQEGEKESMSVTAAALINAKAVAYLHRLHGDPSPRHTWHSASKTKRAQSPARPNPPSPEAMERKPKRDKTPAKKTRPSPDEYGAHNFDEQQASKPETPKPQPAVAEDEPDEPSDEEEMPKIPITRTKAPTPERAAGKKKRFFGKESGDQAAYKSKFQGRKPRRSAAAKVDDPPALTSPPTSPSKMKLKHLEKLDVSLRPSPVKKPATPIGNTISLLAVGKGIELRKKKRTNDIASGRAQPVILTPRSRPTGGNRFKFFPAKEEEIRDPIQRAGRRLLSKSAIPIQCAARTFIAKREAVDRMWAIIELQSYFRRWSCEANLQAHSHSATVVQAMARGWLARKQVDDMHYSATQIQKIVRGYLASALVYDTMYYVVLIQSLGRAYNATKKLALQQKKVVLIQAIFRGYKSRRLQELVKVIIPVQAAYRGHQARQDLALQRSFVLLIQAAWRSYSARIAFQFQVVDTITVQSIFRRWSACRRVFKLNNVPLMDAATKIQATVRGCSARQLKVQIIAARRIQASWRGFQIYTDYIFTVVDVLVVQRTIRQWLAVKKTKALRVEKAAVAIQSHWRSHKSKMTLLYTLVHIIVAQSVARRYLSIIAVQRRKKELVEVAKEDQFRDASAMTIQKAWRGFWGFSHYIIIQYEVTRLQALIRGKLARNDYNLRLGCTIIIQATGRQYLAKKAIDRKVVTEALVAASAHELRERNAAKRVQFWWRIVLDWTKEKKAALTIERFFIHVRAEVDREIMNRERQKKAKKEKRRKRKESLNTVDEDNSDAFAYPKESGTVVSDTSRSQSAPHMRGPSMGLSIPGRDGHNQNQGLRHRASSPTMKLVMRHEDNRSRTSPIQRIDSSASSYMRPTDAVRMAPSEDVSEMSAITTPTVFASTPPKHSQRLRPSRTGRTDVTDELSLEEAFHDLETSQSKDNRTTTETTSQSKDNRMTTDDYIKKYGLKTAPNRSSRNSNHFFGEGNSSVGAHKRQSTGSSQQSTTPRSNPGTPNSQSGAPRIQQVRSPRSNTQQALSPRSRSAPRSQQPSPRGAPNGSSRGWQQQVPSPRTPSGGNSPYRYNFHPPANTPPRQKTPRGKDQKYLSARSVSETVDTSASRSQMTPISHASPESRGALIMKKNYPSPAYTRSIEESQEVLYLGEEYGEV